MVKEDSLRAAVARRIRGIDSALQTQKNIGLISLLTECRSTFVLCKTAVEALIGAQAEIERLREVLTQLASAQAQEGHVRHAEILRALRDGRMP